MLTPQINKRLHALLHMLNLMEQKADLVRQYTNGRTLSTREMDNVEALALIHALEGDREQRSKAMRGKIIHYLCLLGMTLEDGSPNYDRINGWVQNRTGSRNPRKKKLLYLTPAELLAVLTQVEAWYKKELVK